MSPGSFRILPSTWSLNSFGNDSEPNDSESDKEEDNWEKGVPNLTLLGGSSVIETDQH
jgi:hypothetical protein